MRFIKFLKNTAGPVGPYHFVDDIVPVPGPSVPDDATADALVAAGTAINVLNATGAPIPPGA